MFPIKETWKNKLKALYPKDEEECILKLVDKLYTKSFLEILKKNEYGFKGWVRPEDCNRPKTIIHDTK
jgi:hypothetical protein